MNTHRSFPISPPINLLIIVVGVTISTYSSANDRISSVLGTGATRAASPLHRVQATIGQPAIGQVQGSRGVAQQGYWMRSRIASQSGSDEAVLQPRDPHLLTCAPNPFQRSSVLAFDMPEATYARVTLRDMRGAVVMQLANREFLSGAQTLRIDASTLPAGHYMATLETMGFKSSIAIEILK
jgi:hypothetical protein